MRLKAQETFDIKKEFPELGTCEVTLKKFWTAADDEAVTNDQIRLGITVGDDGKGRPSSVEVRMDKLGTALRIIQKWNVEDAAGQPLPITREGIGALPSDVLDWITEEWDKVQVELKKASAPTSTDA